MSLAVKAGAKLPPDEVARRLGLPEPPPQRKWKRPRPVRPGGSVEMTPAKVLEHMRRDRLPDEVAGLKGEASVAKAVMEVATEFNGRKVTASRFIGRFWERQLFTVRSVRQKVGAYLQDSIRMQRFFLAKIHDPAVRIDPATGRRYGGTGFFDANGDSVFLADEAHRDLSERFARIGRIAEVDMEALARHGIVYADRFSIGGREYVDGAFLMGFRGRYIVLLRVEAKTMYSQGVDAQLAAFFVRLASSGRNEAISFHLPGSTRAVTLSRDQFLFDPTWTDAGVGVQEWRYDADAWAEGRTRTPGVLPVLPGVPEWDRGLEPRLDKAVVRAGGLVQPTGFIQGPSAVGLDSEQFARLAVSGPVIYADANLRGLRGWLERLVQAQRR